MSTVLGHSQLLSDDVLAEVFIFCLPERNTIRASHFPQPPFRTPRRREAPLLLCGISSHWRAVALAMPGLWASLNSASIRSPELVQRWLQRSSQSLLSLSVRPFIHDPVGIPMHLHLPILLPEIHRCQNLDIVGWFASGVTQPTLPVLLPLEAAAVSIDRRDTRSAQWFSNLFMNSPSLLQIHWDGPPVSAPWAQLTYLSLAPTNPIDFLHTLAQLGNLIDLHLTGPNIGLGLGLIDLPDSFQSHPLALPQTLPSVVTFSLDTHSSILNFIQLPNLRNLVLVDHSLGEPIMTFLERSECSLHSLEFQLANMRCPPQNFTHRCITPSLTRLAITSEHLSQLFLGLERVSAGTLPETYLLLRDVDLCFRIDTLHLAPVDPNAHSLASIIHSIFPQLEILELDLGLDDESQLESRVVVTQYGQFTLTRPTWLREEYEAWWDSPQGRAFHALWAAGDRECAQAYAVAWQRVDGSIPMQGECNVFDAVGHVSLHEWNNSSMRTHFGRNLQAAGPW